jgi:hypothetical protein
VESPGQDDRERRAVNDEGGPERFGEERRSDRDVTDEDLEEKDRGPDREDTSPAPARGQSAAGTSERDVRDGAV